MIEVTVKNNNIEKALSIFKRKVKDSKLMLELREREFYKKPSELRKEKKARGKIRTKTEKYALQIGCRKIDSETLYDAKAHFKA